MTAERQESATQADFESFYHQTMNVYCVIGRDTILQLPKGSKFGDFATYPDLRWSKAQQTAWRTTGQAPIRLSALPPQDTFVTSTLHASIAQTAVGMPKVSPADYERLQQTPQATMSIWRVKNEWTLLLPKAAIQFTDAQKQACADGTIKADGSNAPELEPCLRAQSTLGDWNCFEYETIRVQVSDVLEEEEESHHSQGPTAVLGANAESVLRESDDEVKAWKENKTSPSADNLPHNTEVLTHLLHFPAARKSEEVRVSPADFRKLDRATRPCVSAWIVSEKDALMMWSTDIEFTDQQRADFREGKINENLSNAPLLIDCLKKESRS